jgi:hypothetical protein
MHFGYQRVVAVELASRLIPIPCLDSIVSVHIVQTSQPSALVFSLWVEPHWSVAKNLVLVAKLEANS